MVLKLIALVALSSGLLLAQSSAPAAGADAQSTTPASASQPAPQPGDGLAQMRDDLNRMESLNMNMSSEIEFLRDQNLQILLRTNSQMWTVLIRDLRRQIEREERRQASPSPSSQSASPKAEERR